MDRRAIANSIIAVLQNLDDTNDEILIRQLASCNDLLETIIIDVNSNFKQTCEHPEEYTECISSMGDEILEYHCKKCDEIFKKQ